MSNLTENYIDYIYLKDLNLINESFESFRKKMTKENVKKILLKVKDQFIKRDFKGMKSLMNKIDPPKIGVLKVKQMMSEKSPGFNKSYSLAKRVLSNSYGKINSDLIDSGSLLVAMKASGDKSTNLSQATRKALKDFSQAFGNEEKNIESSKSKFPKINIDTDEIIGMAFIGACIYVAWNIVSFISVYWVGLFAFVIFILGMIIHGLGTLSTINISNK